MSVRSGTRSCVSYSSAESSLQQLMLLQNLLGAERGKSRSAKDVCIRGNVDFCCVWMWPPNNICFFILPRPALQLVANLCDCSQSKTEGLTASSAKPCAPPKAQTRLLTPQVTPVPAVPKTRGHHEHRETWPPWQNVPSRSEIQTTARPGAQPCFALNVWPPTSVGLVLREAAARRSSLPQPPAFSPQIFCLACWLCEHLISWVICSYCNYCKDLCKQAVKTSCICFRVFFLVGELCGWLVGLFFVLF